MPWLKQPFYLSNRDRVECGVLGGLARSFGGNSDYWRLYFTLACVAAVFGFPILGPLVAVFHPVVLYLVVWIVAMATVGYRD